MQDKKLRKLGWLSLFFLVSINFIVAQYQVQGGTKPPLLVLDSVPLRFQVYLVYGTENLSISYTSSSSSHQWYRYKNKIAEHEPVTSTLQGNTSTVNNPSEEYGYFVKEGDNYNVSNTVWIIDYAKYPVQIQDLTVAKNVELCTDFKLAGTNGSKPMYCQLPAGVKMQLERQFELSYNTAVWNQSAKAFESKLDIKPISENRLFSLQDTIPLMDSDEVILTGDLFARHFGIEQSFSAGNYEAHAIAVRSEKEIISSGETNLNVDESKELLLPAEVRFVGKANTPVASHFKWKITEKSSTTPIIEMTLHPDVPLDHKFTKSGTFKILLEVSDRSGTCTNSEHSFEIVTTDSYLFVPNVFSPEGSPGVNDIFKVAFKSITNFRGWVFNRWGAEIFQWSDPNQGWDGKYRGRYVPAGAYYYVIEYRDSSGKTKKKSGDINVVRSSNTDKNTEKR